MTQLGDAMMRRKIYIICLQETKWVVDKAGEFENTDFVSLVIPKREE